MGKVSCRKAFCDRILEHARKDKDIFAVCTDSRGSVTITPMAQELAEQFVEVGIAEQNSVAVSAGLAVMGKRVFAMGPACFLAARAFEQVKIDVAYNKTNVKIVGVSAGVSYGPLGSTHTSLHDFASMRALPNIEVLTPADAVQARFIADHTVFFDGPAYVRMGRGDVPAVYDEKETFDIEQAKLVCDGHDVTIIACGETVWHAKQAAGMLKGHGYSARVLDMFRIKPADEGSIIKAAKETGALLTVEEHSVHGGLGEMVSRVVCGNYPVPVKVIGFPDEEYLVGKSSDLFVYYGITAENIASQAEILIKRKRS